MKWMLLFTLPAVMVLTIAGCPGKQTDEENIQNLLAESQYTTEAVADDSSKTAAGNSAYSFFADSLPWVRFVRFIHRPITREITAVVTGDSAVATVTSFLAGSFYCDNDPAVGAGLYERAIQDSTFRRVKLVRDSTAYRGWRIVALTPWQSWALGANPITSITKVEATVSSRGYTFTLTDPTLFLTKEALPTFYPADTVTVTVEVATTGDSSWAFLHHGRRAHAVRHFRRPFLKTSTNSFTGSWTIASDSILHTPRLRHAAFDVISWSTLYGAASDTLCFSRVWALPYIVKSPTDTILPPDTTSAAGEL